MKQAVIENLYSVLESSLNKSEIERLIEIPPSEEMGDFAFPCFSLAKILKKSPALIAQEIATTLQEREEFSKVAVVSGYLNIFMNKKKFIPEILETSLSAGFGKRNDSGTVVVEFASPNTNKPLHLGHLRNMSIGDSVARILEFCGNKVIKTSINNDRGVHICKSMLAYKELGDNKSPQSTGTKSDHFVGQYYVLFSKTAQSDPSWNDKAQEMLRKWEENDPETVELWKLMNGWAFDGFRETYSLFGIAFDKEYYESQIYTKGKEIVYDGLKRQIFTTREDGAVKVDLSAENLGEKVLLRPDGTSVYIVQDLYLAVLKNNDFEYDRSIYVVGNEQDYHFNVLGVILKKLGYGIASKMFHLSYGMVELPEGKMKSREGTVVDADDLIKETQSLAKEELRTRYTLSEEAIEERSLRIALAAIKYQLLKVDISKNMLFDPKKAISFEGDTGPYLLYSYARASSILRKASSSIPAQIDEFEPTEIRLVKKIGLFPEVVNSASEKLSPTLVAVYAFELSQIFNEFYHCCPVIGSAQVNFRIKLVESFKTVLKKCLDLLGISEIEEM